MNFSWVGLGGGRSPPPQKCRWVGGLGEGRAQPSLPPEFRGGVGGAKPPPPTPIQKGADSEGPASEGPASEEPEFWKSEHPDFREFRFPEIWILKNPNVRKSICPGIRSEYPQIPSKIHQNPWVPDLRTVPPYMGNPSTGSNGK